MWQFFGIGEVRQNLYEEEMHVSPEARQLVASHSLKQAEQRGRWQMVKDSCIVERSGQMKEI